MAEPRKIAIVPARNEKGAIGDVVREIRDFDPDLDVLVIDDGSTDETAELAAAAGAIVLRLPFNLGIGGAVQTGFKYAVEHRYELAVRLDGDGQHDPAELPKLMGPLLRGEADIVVGSRFADPDPAYRPPLARRLGIGFFAAVVSLLVRQRVTDTTSGFQALNERGIRAVRRRLPARLPGGGGDGDGRAAPAAAPGGARPDARTRARAFVDHRCPLDVLHGEGAARARRRDVPAHVTRTKRMTPFRVSLFATIASLLLILVVFELIRSRRLRERYALLWLLTGVVLLVLSAWRGGLNTIAGWVGISTYPPAVLFAIGTLFILLVLLHYSTVISKLSDQNVILAQRLALLEERLQSGERDQGIRTTAPLLTSTTSPSSNES